MSVESARDLQEVYARLMWIESGASSAGLDRQDWQAAAVTLHAALGEALDHLKAAGFCRDCGKPLGAYCIECAWPHKRRDDRRRGG